jgi:hypothetical protein
MSSQIIPLSNAQNQTFKVQLAINATQLTLNISVNYSAMAGYWLMTLSDVNGNLLISAIPLITGWYPAANLLSQYQYMRIGSAYLLNVGGLAMDYPDQTSLSQFSLLWGDNV